MMGGWDGYATDDYTEMTMDGLYQQIKALTAEVERLREVANIAREWVHSTCLSCKQQPMYKYRECEGDVCFAYSLMQALEGGQG
jgi:hypothetical protein